MKAEEKITVVAAHGLTSEDAQRWYGCYYRHVYRARERGLESHLSFNDYMQKVSEAGLDDPDQLGVSLGQYHLGRVGDVGDYEVERCRFITVSQNRREAHENGCYENLNASMRGQSKETSEKYRQLSETLSGRTKDSHEYLAEKSKKMTGQTKETNDAVARRSATITGRTRETHSGLAVVGEKTRERMSKDFVIIDPQGNIHEGRNIRDFCRERGLDSSQMSKALRGESHHHKGHTGYLGKLEPDFSGYFHEPEESVS